jgi:hypothetical protein
MSDIEFKVIYTGDSADEPLLDTLETSFECMESQVVEPTYSCPLLS